MDEIKWNGFLRQRRALLAASIVLAISHLAGITLEKISFLGNELKVGSPIALNIALWVFWGYWLWRFYAYSSDVGARNTTLSVYNGKFYELLRKYVEQNASTLFLRAPEVIARVREDARLTEAKCEGVELLGVSDEGYRVRAHGLTVEYKFEDGTGNSMTLGTPETVVSHGELRPIKRQSMRYVIFHSPIGTDFWLPYLVAAVPILIAMTQGVIILFRQYL